MRLLVMVKIVRAIVIFTIIIAFLIYPLSCDAAGEPDLIIETNIKYMFEEGGGEIEIEVTGDLAQAIRQDIFEEFNLDTTNQYAIIKKEETDKYAEVIEDLLELKINPQRMFYDKNPSDAGVDYDGVYKLVKITRVDVSSIKGLEGTNRQDTTKITISMDIKGDLLEDSGAILSDGYIILYALWGEKNEELPITNIDVKEKTTITIISTGSISEIKMDNDGQVSRYRLVMGEIFEYNNQYQLKRYNLSTEKKDTVRFESANPIQNSLILFIIILFFAIVPIFIANFIVRKKLMKKVIHLRIFAIIVFIILLVIYFLGIDGAIIWGAVLLLFCVNLVLIHGIYNRGWGNLVQVTIRHEDFIRPPPVVEDGPWHERGIANAKLGNLSIAVNNFEMALEADPDNPIIWNDLGFVHRKLKNYRQASECFNKAISLRPGYQVAVDKLQKTLAEYKAKQKK